LKPVQIQMNQMIQSVCSNHRITLTTPAVHQCKCSNNNTHMWNDNFCKSTDNVSSQCDTL